MATDPIIPFQYLPTGPADSAKTGQNFEELLKYIRDRNDGTAQWDTLDVLGNADIDGNLVVGGTSTLTSAVTINGSGAETQLNINNTATDGDPAIFFQLSGTDTFYVGIDDSLSDALNIGRGGAVGTTPDVVISQSTGAVSIRGTATNDSASTGYVGEYQSVAQGSLTNFPTTTQWGDLGSISLTAGDWDVFYSLYADSSGATWSGIRIFIGTVSGNDATGRVVGSNGWQESWASSSTTPVEKTIQQQLRISISSTTTYYAKVSATYTAGTPRYLGFMMARRVR